MRERAEELIRATTIKVTDEDVAATVAGGHADIMVAHDAPVGVPEIDQRLAGKAHRWDPEDLLYAGECREMFTLAVARVLPDLLIHGHYHFPVCGSWPHPGILGETRVIGLGTHGDFNHALGVLRAGSLRAEHVLVHWKN